MRSQEYTQFVQSLKCVRYHLSTKTIALQYHFRNREEENYESEEKKLRDEVCNLRKLVKEGEDLIVESRISSKKLQDYIQKASPYYCYSK
jgi:hypothetical protein